MSEDEIREAFRAFVEDALRRIRESGESVKAFSGRIAYFDTSKDGFFTHLPAFAKAVTAIESLPSFLTQATKGDGGRIVLQFVYILASRLTEPILDRDVFEDVFGSLIKELSTSEWTHIGIANIQNFHSSSHLLDLGNGITIRGRSFKDLSVLLKWEDEELKFLADDWMQGAFGSHVLVVEEKQPKSPENFILSGTGSEGLKAQKALMVLRLLKSGDVRIGRIFLFRPASFNVGIGGLRSSGFTVWHPGKEYHLEQPEIDGFRRVNEMIETYQNRYKEKWANVEVALRSFSSIYDRYLHQAEDRILDAITALEALFALSTELSFRLAFLTAAILSSNDDERVNTFQDIRKYYKVRNAIVHGDPLDDDHWAAIQSEETLRAYVRRLLVGFLHLIESGAFSSSRQFTDKLDSIVLHSGRLQELRERMGLV